MPAEPATPSPPAPIPEEPPLPAGLAEAGVYPNLPAADQHGLVILALGEEYWCLPAEPGYRLLVPAAALPEVRDQLARFDRESIGWPPRPSAPDRPVTPVNFGPALLWMLSVLLAATAQQVWPLSLPAAGALDSSALFDRGEVWRLATALFLHADYAHLVGNLIAGLGVFAAVGATLGQRRGWLLLAGAALLGNAASAALHYPGPYRSLGASTAIFAGLGLLTGRASRVRQRAGRRWHWRPLLLPLATGAVLLALYGGGSADDFSRPTDLIAHTTGFAAGLVLGFGWGRAPDRRLG